MRYLPLTDDDRRDMLAAIGVGSIDDLFTRRAARPRGATAVDLPLAQGELEVERALSRMAAKNVAAGSAPFFIGGGVYRHHVPAAVDHLIQRGEFLTSYTPYQPEVAQGTLQSLFEFQTQVALLTGMEVANASIYDGATACAEAVMMANRVTRRRQGGAVGRAAPALPRGAARPTRNSPDSRSAALAATPRRRSDCADRRQYRLRRRAEPRFLRPAARLVGAGRGAAMPRARCWSSSSPRSCRSARSRSPGEMGADIVAAEGQSLGNALNFGGPHVGLFATPREVSCGRCRAGWPARPSTPRAARLGADAVDPRAAHPPREGDQQHLHQFGAVRAGLHDPPGAAWRGRADPPRRGSTTPLRASSPSRLAAVPGDRRLNQSFFNEFTLRLPKPAAPVVEALAEVRRARRACRCQPLISRARRSRRSAAGRGDRDRHRRRHRPNSPMR